MQNRRLILGARQKVTVSSAVSVEYNDALFLGEVMASRPDGDSGWQVEVGVEQILTGLESLIALRSRLLGESVSSTAALVTAHATK